MAGRVVYYGGIVTDGLVMHFDSAKYESYPKTGNVINDIGKIENNIYDGTLSSVEYNEENRGTLFLDGSASSYIDIANSQNLISPTFTIDIWLKTSPVVNSANAYVLAKQYDGGYGTYVFNDQNTSFQFAVGTDVFYYIAETPINRDAWYHFTGVYDGTNIYLYKNGVFVSSATTVGSIRTRSDSVGKVNLGRYGLLFPTSALSSSYNFGACSYYNRVLSSAEILKNYNALKNRYIPYDTDFIITVKTDNAGSSASNQFTLPLYPGETYNSTIYWGDGTSTQQTTSSSPTHTYPSAGTYTIRIQDTFASIYFNGAGDCLKLLSIDNWGNTVWKKVILAYYNCQNMVANYRDKPNLSQITDMSNMFIYCYNFNGSVAGWDTSNATAMFQTFHTCTLFNKPIDSWDVSKVQSFSFMFVSCINFNQSLNSWVTSAATNMSAMFQGCINFNQPVNHFITSGVTNMNAMFNGCSVFNQPVNSWNVSKVTNTAAMFWACSNFNGSLNNWVTSAVTDMNGMFVYCYNFNQPLNHFITSGVTNMTNMFVDCNKFNQPLNNWNTSLNTGMFQMFYGCTLFNQDISMWNTSAVTIMSNTFQGCVNFNKSLSGWNTSNVTTMISMFSNCQDFNQPLNHFITSAVTNMSQMFYGCLVFNQSLSDWNTSAVTSVAQMFWACYNFNGSLSGWNTSSLTDMTNMFTYCYSFNQPVNHFITSGVTSMVNVFFENSAFNQPLNNWDTSRVTSMYQMFYNDAAFNQDISMWNVSGVTDFNSFMYGKTAANYDAAKLDAIYNNWSLLTLQPGLSINFGSIKYTAAGSAGRTLLTNAPNSWSIADGGI